MTIVESSLPLMTIVLLTPAATLVTIEVFALQSRRRKREDSINIDLKMQYLFLAPHQPEWALHPVTYLLNVRL